MGSQWKCDGPDKGSQAPHDLLGWFGVDVAGILQSTRLLSHLFEGSARLSRRGSFRDPGHEAALKTRDTNGLLHDNLPCKGCQVVQRKVPPFVEAAFRRLDERDGVADPGLS